MWQMKQMQPSFSLQTKTSEEIASEAKEYLLCKTDEDEIQLRVMECLKPWAGQQFNFQAINNVLNSEFQQLSLLKKIFKYNINILPDNGIHIQYMKTPSAEVIVLDIKII